MASIVKGTLEFRCDVFGYIFRSFEPIEVQTTEPCLGKVVVECRDESPVTVSILVASAPSIDSAIISGKVICRTIAARLSLRYGLCIQEPLLISQSLIEEKDGETRNLAGGSISLFCPPGKESVIIDRNESIALKTELEDLRPSKEDYEELYRIAMQSEDNVDRYMSLYRILSLLYPSPSGKEKQEFVDRFIEQNSEESRIYPRPDMPNILETIYSKLRNEIGHARPGVDLSSTRNGIDTWVYKLAPIVRDGIRLKT